MELSTIAKPYANAIFEIAEQNQSHASWKSLLEAGAQLANDEEMQIFIAAPSVTKAKKAQVITALFSSVLGGRLNAQENAFVGLLFENNRINALSSILALFDDMVNRASDSKTFDVISAYQLSGIEEKQIASYLSDKYSATVSIDTKIDKSLVGGIVVKEGDKVIDLSIKARVDELGLCLSIN